MYDAIICGAGPVGLLCACLLGQSGWNVLLVEKRGSGYGIPRAIHGDARMMRAFEAAGLKEALKAHISPMQRMRFATLEGKLLLELPMPSEDFWFFQPNIEEILQERLLSLPSVETRMNTALKHFSQKNRQVSVVFENGSSLKSRYLLGCDGANSTVRNLLGIGLLDMNFDQRWAVFDAVADAPPAGLPPCHQQYCGVERAITFVPGTGRHLRWEVRMKEGETAVPELLYGLFPSLKGLSFVRMAEYRFHALLATQWQQGNVFLTGDAAHQMPPFAGQGLCVGLEDAQTLCALLLAGDASSYEKKRKNAALRAIKESVNVGKLVNPSQPWKAVLLQLGLRLLQRWPWAKQMVKRSVVK